MSITLNDLLAWSERLPDPTSEEARMLRAMIERREAELRTRIADLIATVSQRENWKLHRCAATARRVEQTPTDRLESVFDYFHDRSLGRLPADAREPLKHDGHEVEQQASAPAVPITLTPARNVVTMPITISEPVSALYSRMRSLESLVAPTPGIGCGVQGIRIMRMVALMSKARSARMAQMRISGTQFVYRHA
ncbi:hypothetical protein [Caballeronia sp. BR00000012568055]|uniref:hypothetical protein n=1 Tax=Caballeronia sp. BR00000012568055 TaxID=2918761 RepID=UPI0023F7B228|nr:hypothetical protein [Caballeronia sp. BR00000012568055]